MNAPESDPVDELLAQAGWVRRLARRLVRDSSSADDLAQGALAAALATPPGHGRPLRPWLAAVVTNLARKETRSAMGRADRERIHGEATEQVPGTDQLMQEMEQQARIARLVSELPDPYRAVVLLRYYRGLSSAEIARSKGVPGGTIRSQLARGLDLLKARMAEDSGGDHQNLGSCLLLAAGLSQQVPWGGAPSPSAALPMAAPMALAPPTLFIMSAGTKSLLACATVVALLAGLAGWRSFQSAPPPVPDLAAAPGAPELASPAPSAVGAPEVADAPSSRSGLRPQADAGPSEHEDVEPALVPEEATGPTGFFGRAVDGKGKPIEGAAFVSVDQWGAPTLLGESQVSGSDGVVRIELPRKAFFTYGGRSSSNTYLALGAPGFATDFTVPAAPLGGQKDLGDIVLNVGATVEGLVVDQGGAPVPGALVVAALGSPVGDNLAPVLGPERDGGRPTTRTDQHGRFRLHGMHTGAGHVWASAPGMRWAMGEALSLGPGATEPGVTLILEPMGPETLVQGVVEDPLGNPVAGAKVSYRHAKEWDDPSVQTDGQGAFYIPVPKGLVLRLRACAPELGFGPSQEVSAASGEEQVRLPLTERRVVKLRVVQEAGGAPIENAVAMVLPVEEKSYFLDSRWIRSDDAGQMEFLAPGEPFRLRVGGRIWEYQGFGPYVPNAAPKSMTVELQKLPLIEGLVRAAGEPLAGATVNVLLDYGKEYRPLQSGFPMRLFHNGAGSVETDERGLFAVPPASGSDPTVLLVAKDGLATAEIPLGLVDKSKGMSGIEVSLSAGGSLEGQVILGPGRNPASVVVAISRGDGQPKFTRPGPDGHYRFDHLTPGPWRVEDRDVEPEGRTLGAAQGDDKPLRWDCDLREGETTVYDLDLRWQDNLQVEGRVTWDGAGAKGWTAALEAPDYADRPWPPRLVTLDTEGHFAIEARPGDAKLVLRSPEGAPVTMVLKRDLEVGPDRAPHDFEFITGDFQGQVGPSDKRLRLFHRVDPKTSLKVNFKPDADGSFRLPLAPAGQASFQAEHEVQGGMGGSFMGWRQLQMIHVIAGKTTAVDVTD